MHSLKRFLIINVQVGDGTNLVIMLAGALLKEAEDLLRMGLKPTEVAEGYELALEKALAILETLSIRREGPRTSQRKVGFSCCQACVDRAKRVTVLQDLPQCAPRSNPFQRRRSDTFKPSMPSRSPSTIPARICPPRCDGPTPLPAKPT